MTGRVTIRTSGISPGAGVERDRVDASGLRRGNQRHASRTGVQDQRRLRRLSEVEVVYQVAQDMGAFADIRTRITPSVGGRVEPGVMEEVIFYELDVSVERQVLVVDKAVLGVGADHHGRHPDTVAAAIH